LIIDCFSPRLSAFGTGGQKLGSLLIFNFFVRKMEKIQAIKLARSYLIENIGNMTGPGEVYYDKRKNAWRVEVFYEDGFFEFKIGELEVNERRFTEGKLLNEVNTQEINAPSKSELLKRLQEQMSQGLTVLVEIEKPDERTHQLIKELAAGIVVGKVGTASVTTEELRESLLRL